MVDHRRGTAGKNVSKTAGCGLTFKISLRRFQRQKIDHTCLWHIWGENKKSGYSYTFEYKCPYKCGSNSQICLCLLMMISCVFRSAFLLQNAITCLNIPAFAMQPDIYNQQQWTYKLGWG